MRARLFLLAAAISTATVACSLLVDTEGLIGHGAPDGGPEATDAGPLDSAMPDSATPDSATPDSATRLSPAPDGGGIGSPYSSTVLSDQPSCFFRVEESSGTTARDETGRTLGLYSGKFALGVSGAYADSRGFEVNGGPGGLSAGNCLDFSARRSYSIEMWFSARVYDWDFRMLAGSDVTANGDRESILLYVRKDFGVVFERIIGGAALAPGAAPLPAIGEFAHVVATYDGKLIRLFMNGVAFGETSDERPANASGTLMFGDIGFRRYTNFTGFVGVVDEIAVYDHALTSERVAAHFLAARR
jgi:hypothetical protein